VAASGGFVHGHTYFTNPLSCAVAHAVVDEVVRQDLVVRARDRGAYLMARLNEVAARSPIVGDVRGKGLLTAIEIVADKPTRRQLPVAFNAPARLTEHGLKHGIALYNRRANLGAFGDFQMITPPLTITEPELDELADLLEKSLRDLADEIARKGLA
jgi:adenosylmethionine-8-amino-7-oxononanoate aminotransferase